MEALRQVLTFETPTNHTKPVVSVAACLQSDSINNQHNKLVCLPT